MDSVLAFDLGSKGINAGLVDTEHDAMTGHWFANLADPDATEALEAMAEAARQMLRMIDRRRVSRVGIAVPASVEDGIVGPVRLGRFSGMEGMDLAAWLRERFDTRRVAVVDDAVAYAMGELCAWQDEGVDRGRSCVVRISTGVSCAVLDDRRLAPVDRDPTVERVLAAGSEAALSDIDGYRRWLAGCVATISAAYSPAHLIVGVERHVEVAGERVASVADLLNGIEQDVATAGVGPALHAGRRRDDAAMFGVAGVLGGHH